MNPTPRDSNSHESGDETRFRLALAAGGLGMWEWDRRLGTITWDKALEEMFGLPPGGGPTDFDGYLNLLHPEDREDVVNTISQSLTTGLDFGVEHRIIHPDGEIRWMGGRGHPIVEGDEIVGMIGVTGDITVQHEAEQVRSRLLAEESAARAAADAANARLEFIADATAAMSESVDLHDRLNELSRLSIPRFADGASVHLIGDDGKPHLIALHHRDPEQLEIIRYLYERFPIELHHKVGIGAVLREGKSGWLPKITDEMLQRAALDDTHLTLLRKLDLTAGLTAPLNGADGTFGAVTFVTTGGRQISAEDLELVEHLCSRIAVLVRNAQLLESRELERQANRYQAALLRAIFEAGVDGMLAVGTEGEVLSHNKRFLQLWSLDESLPAKGDDALLAEAEQRVIDPEHFIASVRGAYRDRPAHVRDEVLLANGRVLDRHGSRINSPEGEYLGFLWTFRDITLERAQREAIAEAGERSATLAHTLQHNLLPPRLPTITGLELGACYHAAFEGLDVGGDFYDVFAVPDDWMLVIGDVCGKGAEAASLTALARYTLRATASHSSHPSQVLAELNAVMMADAKANEETSRFATVCCIRLRKVDGGVEADVACGGHPPPLVIRADHTIETAGTPGTLMGVFDQVEVTTTTTLLRPGDSIVCVTDGVLEARGSDGEQFERAGVARVLAPLANGHPAQMCSALEAAALEIQGGVARDDIAILIARVAPES